jgi:hypothetical protein
MHKKTDIDIPRPWDDNEEDDDDDYSIVFALSTPITVHYYSNRTQHKHTGQFLGSYVLEDRSFLLMKNGKNMVRHIPIDSISSLDHKIKRCRVNRGKGDVMIQ